eukprot:2782429-Pleurochrysis_carterae.AAC.3
MKPVTAETSRRTGYSQCAMPWSMVSRPSCLESRQDCTRSCEYAGLLMLDGHNERKGRQMQLYLISRSHFLPKIEA